MKGIYNLLLTLAFLCSVASQAQNTSHQYKSEIRKARFLITEHQKMTNIPGVQVAVMIDGQIIWSESFGYADFESKSSVTYSTQFRIASVSKAVTSLALGKLAEQGVIDLDENIRTYLPEFPQKKYPITARHLAASVSGIRHYNSSDPFPNEQHYDDVFTATALFRDDPLQFQPGTQYLYSSFGWVLLSAVMERAFGKSFEPMMKQVWSDVDMKNTSFDDPFSENTSKSKFYVSGKNGSRVVASIENRSYMYAGGGYLSTAEDLVKMSHQLISDTYLSAKTRNLLTASYVLANGDSTHYGLGWETGKSRLNAPVLFHGGSMSTARSHLVIYPEQKVVFAYLSNTGDNVFCNDREAQSIAEIFVEKIMNPEESGSLDKLDGSWKIETTSLRNKPTEGQLILSDGQGTITFKRSKKELTMPIVATKPTGDNVHLIAVSPMFIDFYLTLKDNKLSGYWLHDFNVKGLLETDEYWKAREITGTKTKLF